MNFAVILSEAIGSASEWRLKSVPFRVEML